MHENQGHCRIYQYFKGLCSGQLIGQEVSFCYQTPYVVVVDHVTGQTDVRSPFHCHLHQSTALIYIKNKKKICDVSADLFLNQESLKIWRSADMDIGRARVTRYAILT